MLHTFIGEENIAVALDFYKEALKKRRILSKTLSLSTFFNAFIDKSGQLYLIDSGIQIQS